MGRARSPDDFIAAPAAVPDHLGKRLRAYALAELDHARAALKIRKVEKGEGVHEARKSLRHARAALRLGDSKFRHAARPLDEALRDLARSLSPLRDAQVMIGTLDQVFEDDPLPFDEDLRGKARAALRHRRRTLIEKYRHADPHLHRLRQHFKAVRKDLAALPWKHIAAHNVERALAKSCDRIQAAHAQAIAHPDGAARHAWRRRIRRLRHQLRALAAIGMDAAGACGVAVDAHAAQADRLGDEQDLRVLDETVGRLNGLSGAECALLRRSIVRRIDALMAPSGADAA
ncbi:MAG TPA: CHAD domain-containing protein [Rudaea sp.]